MAGDRWVLKDVRSAAQLRWLRREPTLFRRGDASSIERI
jgi:hypothetical protein